jgi:hypothetical protein
MPICWEPEIRRDEHAYRRKLILCASGLPSTHWASLGRQHIMTMEEAHFTTSLNLNDGSHKSICLPRSSVLPASLISGINFEEEVMKKCSIIVFKE